MDGVKEALDAVKDEIQTEVKPAMKDDAAAPPADTAAATAAAPVSTTPEK